MITSRKSRLFSVLEKNICHQVGLVTCFCLVPADLSLFMFEEIWEELLN
jgi:hypothetical protein